MLRVLVACLDCRRQHDATGFAAGSRFHCSCGATLDVPEPGSHDAAVVRCTSCGGARSRGDATCGFCGADFTLRERELHTICPVCMTRIADSARFCHHCGTPITPLGRVGEPTTRRCPACGPRRRLVSRELGQVAVLECGGCAGLWLGRDVFELQLERARREGAAADAAPPSAPASPAAGAGSRGSLYRPCPDCRELMHRRNFGGKSGVILDTCREHGVWFDPRELDRVLHWIRTGGEERAKERAAERLEQAARAGRFAPSPLATRAGGFGEGGEGSELGPAWAMLERLIGTIFSRSAR